MNTRHFSQLPKPYLAYPKVIQGLIFKKPKGEKVLPQVEYVVDSFKVDQKHLKAYNAVTGFKNNGYIPASENCYHTDIDIKLVNEEEF